MPKLKYQDQIQIARQNYLEREDTVGMSYLANLELGDWLTKNFDWDWYTTHTFSDGMISKHKADGAWQSWLNGLVLTCKARGLPRPHYVRATEHQENRDCQTIHFHALIGGIGDISRLLFKDMWELWGIGRVVEYDPQLGAGFYVGKYMTKYDCELRFSRNLKRRLLVR